MPFVDIVCHVIKYHTSRYRYSMEGLSEGTDHHIGTRRAAE
jgi:hypothetical protein